MKPYLLPGVALWGQLAGAGVLSGIGFTMSLFIASEAFPRPSDFAATKIAVFTASGLAAAIGTFVLWHTSRAGKAPSREAASEAVLKACTVIDEGVGEPA